MQLEIDNTPLCGVGDKVVRERYLRKDEDGNLIENWAGLCKRVVDHVCVNENQEFKDKVYDLIYNTKFLPNSPCLVNSGNSISGLLACTVTKSPEDSWLGMCENLANFGHIARRGGGAGADFSLIRPEGDPVFGSTHAKACGPIQHMRVISESMSSITQAGFRAMANIGVLRVDHPDIEKFIVCKQRSNALRSLLKEDPRNHFEQMDGHTSEEVNIILDKFMSNFNISVGVTDEFMKKVEKNQNFDLIFGGKIYKTVKARDLFNLIATNAWKNGDPGLLFYGAINDGPYKYSGQKITATNPCFHGDTMVAVADGRNAVSFKQLAEDGKDVPVYCRNSRGGVSIHWMRNPRITGYNQKILKITIENGHTLRTTENHKFVMLDGTTKEAKDLQKGDSLSIMSKVSAPFEKMLKKWNSKTQKYYWINASSQISWKLEHRIIYNFCNNKNYSYGDGTIHHKDYNALNNNPANLEWMIKSDHDKLHCQNMFGDSNPMRRAKNEWSEEDWSRYGENMSKSVSGLLNSRAYNISNEELFNQAVFLTKEKNRKLSSTEWRKWSIDNGFVSQFSNFREQELGTISEFLTKAAQVVGIENAEYSHSDLREYNRFLKIREESDLNVYFDKGIMVRKNCEECGKEFSVKYYMREICFCSQSCFGVNLTNRPSFIQHAKETRQRLRDKKKIILLNAYNKFKTDIGREPFKKEFQLYCKSNKIPFRIPSKREASSGKLIPIFDSWKQLKKESLTLNHKVIKVEQDGTEDVYNGTVDKYHNLYVGHFLEKYDDCDKFVYINTLQCGEQNLPEFGSCNLGSLDISKFYEEQQNDLDWKSLKNAIYVAVQFLDNVIDVNKFPTPDFYEWALKNRPVGLGIMGWADLLLKMKIAYGSPQSIKLARKLGKFMQEESHKKSVELGKERGTPECCKFKELEFRRNVTLLSIAPTGSISLIAGCSSSVEPVFSSITYREDNTGKYEMKHPDADSEYFKCAVGGKEEHKITWQQHIEIQAAFQENCCNAISKTCNLENSATVEDVYNAYMLAWKLKNKGITVYRDRSKTTQVLNTTNRTGIIGYNNALKRPDSLPCHIYNTTASGFEWHIIIGLLNGNPYEVFAVNGKINLPEFGTVVKKGKRYYALLDESGKELIGNLATAEEKIDPRISMETRRFSLELRHQIHPKYICEQIDKSNDLITSFSKAVNRIMKKNYLDIKEINTDEMICVKCAQKGKLVAMIPESACWRCPECKDSKCG